MIAAQTSSSSPDGLDVLDMCHRQMLSSLGRLSSLIARLSNLGPDEEARAMAGEILNFFSTTVRQHHQDEERHVFPKLVGCGDPGIVDLVLRLHRDHDWLEEDWMEIAPHLAAVAAGRSSYDLQLLRDGAAAFTALMHDHIALEESLIYPAAREALAAGQRRAMGREMAARRRADRALAVRDAA